MSISSLRLSVVLGLALLIYAPYLVHAVEPADDAAAVVGTLVIPKTVEAFADHTLEIKLWEYDPRLADVGANLVGEFKIEKFSHAADKESKTKFTVGDQLKPRDDRSYYITVFILKDDNRTHIGEQDGKPGLCKVLTGGNPREVTMVVRKVK